jgi:hypothetical protein
MSVYNNSIYFSLNSYNPSQRTYIVAVHKIDRNGQVTVLYHKSDAGYGVNAHNIHGPYIAFVGSGHDIPVLLVPFGDLFTPGNTHDSSTDAGKVLIMDLNGHAIGKDVFDTGHGNNMHLAYGNRNMFQVTCLNYQQDRYRRCVWSENGNSVQRLVFTSLLGGNSVDLKWTGDDSIAWLNMQDTTTGSSAVLHSRLDTSCVYLTILPELTDRNEIVFLESCTGSRVMTLKKIVNLYGAQPAVVEVQTILTSKITTASAPMASALVPGDTGQVVVGDVYTGDLYTVSNPMLKYENYRRAQGTLLTQVTSHCSKRPTWKVVYLITGCVVFVQWITITCDILWNRRKRTYTQLNNVVQVKEELKVPETLVVLTLCAVVTVWLWWAIPNEWQFI